MSINAPLFIFLVVSHMDDDSQKKTLQSYMKISLKILEMMFFLFFLHYQSPKKMQAWNETNAQTH